MAANSITATIQKQADIYVLGIETQQKRITHPFVPIPEGSFTRYDADVNLRSFYMAQFSVTQELYEAVTGRNPSSFKAAQNPVEEVSWYDSVEFCVTLNNLLGFSKPFYHIDNTQIDPSNTNTNLDDPLKWLVRYHADGQGVRLPTEAEWEYAGRAGAELVDRESLPENEVLPQHNAWGLYRMTDCLWQWCWDWFGKYPTENTVNPIGIHEAAYRVCRGGSWGNFGWTHKLTDRDGKVPVYHNLNMGFRLVFVP